MKKLKLYIITLIQIGLKKTIYIDTDNTGRYVTGGKFAKDQNQRGLKGGLFKVSVIEVFDWDNKKQQNFKKDYYFYRSESYGIKEFSVFDDVDVAYTLAHDIPAIDIVYGLRGKGLHCLTPIGVKDGKFIIYKDELILANDISYVNKELLQIYNKSRKIYGVKNDYNVRMYDNSGIGIIDKNKNDVLVYVHKVGIYLLKNTVEIDDNMNLVCKVRGETTKDKFYVDYKFFGENYKNYISSEGHSGNVNDKDQWLANRILNIAIRCIK